RARNGYHNWPHRPHWPHWPRARPDEHDERREKHRGVQQEEAPEARSTAKGGEEILLKTAPYSGQGTVHTHVDDALTVEAQPAFATRAPQMSQALVLENFIAHSSVPAHGLIAGALDKHARAMNQAERGVIAHERERGGEEAENDEIEHRHERPFPEAHQCERRPGREQRHFALSRLCAHPGAAPLGEPRVGVEKEQPRAASLLGESRAGEILAAPALR